MKFCLSDIFMCLAAPFPTFNTRKALRHTAAHCSTLQHTAAHCSTLQHTATICNTVQHNAATPCNTLQHIATACNRLQHTLHDTATDSNRLQQIFRGNTAPRESVMSHVRMHHTHTPTPTHPHPHTMSHASWRIYQ